MIADILIYSYRRSSVSLKLSVRVDTGSSLVSVQVFFNMVPSISRLIHRSTFEERLRLPPTHPNFPHTSLLHAICAVSARYSAAVNTISTDEWVHRVDERLKAKNVPKAGQWGIEESIAMEECFGERNAKYAQLEAKLEGTVGRKLMDIVQGMVNIHSLVRVQSAEITGINVLLSPTTCRVSLATHFALFDIHM